MSKYSSIWPDDYRPLGFSDEMEDLRGFFVFYVFQRKRRPVDTKWVQRGFVREIDHPYRRGRGLQIRAGTSIWGIGLCRKRSFADDDEATEKALEARVLSDDIYEIGDW